MTLSWLEDCAYRRLLDAYYADRALPSDLERLYHVCRAKKRAEKLAVQYVVATFFSEISGSLFNNRAEKEMAWREDQRKLKSDAGKASVIARLGKYGTTAPVHQATTNTEHKPDRKIEQNDEQTLEQPVLDVFRTQREPPDPDLDLRSKSKTNLPHLESATKIVSYYEEIIRDHRPSHPRAIKNVRKLISSGEDPKALWECVGLYLPDAETSKATFRIAAANFFGRDAAYKAYIEDARKITVEVEG
jgi:uncharacterized protein YdaU (DUF1376 family)